MLLIKYTSFLKRKFHFNFKGILLFFLFFSCHHVNSQTFNGLASLLSPCWGYLWASLLRNNNNLSIIKMQLDKIYDDFSGMLITNIHKLRHCAAKICVI